MKDNQDTAQIAAICQFVNTLELGRLSFNFFQIS